MSRQIKLADAAVALGKWITAVCAMVLAIMAFWYLAIIGPEIQARRMGITVEEFEARDWREVERRIEAARIESECGWECMKRRQETGEWE